MSRHSPTPTAREFMNSEVHTLDPDMPLADVIASLLRWKVSSAPVVRPGARHELIGFISEADCLRSCCEEVFFSLPSVTASSIMRRHPICVGTDTDLFAMASILAQHGLRHLPVAENGELLGIVSRRDVLRALSEYQQEASRAEIEERFPPDLHEIVNHRFILR